MQYTGVVYSTAVVLVASCLLIDFYLYALQLGTKEKRWILTFAECLQADILLPYWLAARMHPAILPAAGSLREPPSEVLISDPKVNQPKQARRPRMRIQRAHDRALAIAMAPPWPTGRGRMPEGPRSAMARAHGVFSEMPSRNRALGDGGAGLVHGQASVRSLTVCL